MTKLTSFIFLILIISSCGGYSGRYSDGFVSDDQERIEELEAELQEANDKIAEYESRFDYIRSEASDGYDAIAYFNWSYELQEALDAFESIQSYANY